MKKKAILWATVAILLIVIIAVGIIPLSAKGQNLFTEKDLETASASVHESFMYTKRPAGCSWDKEDYVYAFRSSDDEALIKSLCLNISVIGDAREEDIPFGESEFLGRTKIFKSIIITVDENDIYEIYLPCGTEGRFDENPYSHIYENDRETAHFYVKHQDEIKLCSAPVYYTSQFNIQHDYHNYVMSMS